MFRIGEFSRIARVSCRLLRYYDELDLFKPEHIDDDSGYRYYSASQLPRLNRILVLKDLGLSLEQITNVLKNDLPVSELRGMLLLRRNEIERSIESESERLRQIESRIAQIEAEGRFGPDDVILRQEPARKLLSIRQAIASFEEGVQLIMVLVAAVPRMVSPNVLGQFVVIAHGQDFEFENIDAEFGFFLESGGTDNIVLSDGRELVVRDVPPIERLAVGVHIGPPQDAHLITARIGQFIESNGYRICGPNRELFLQRPHMRRVQESIVEMQFPIEKI